MFTGREHAVTPSTIRTCLAASCLLLASPVMLTAVCVPATAGPFEDGVTAYWQDDFDTALQLWRPLAEHGNVGAQYYLGIMYENGRGVKRDYAEALRWYRKAADQNFAVAQINLGTMYEHGEGVERDYDEASSGTAKLPSKATPTPCSTSGARTRKA